METKKLVSIIVIISIMTLPLGVSATDVNNTTIHKSEIKVYTNVHGCKFHEKQNFTILSNSLFFFYASLYIDGKWKQYRYLHCDLFDSKGKMINTKKSLTDWRGAAAIDVCDPFTINRKPTKLKVGEYILRLYYNGNTKDNYPPTEKYVKLHVI